MTSDTQEARGAPELLPCPFCGAEMGPHDGMRWVLCVECGAESGRQIDAASAIAAWNCRTTPTAPAASPEVAKLIAEAEARGLRVKALEWRELVTLGEWEATSAVGVYRVDEPYWMGPDGEWQKGGKRAAQADYEARIRAALDLTTEPEPTSGAYDMICCTAEDVVQGRGFTGDAAADLATAQESLRVCLALLRWRDGE